MSLKLRKEMAIPELDAPEEMLPSTNLISVVGPEELRQFPIVLK